MSAHTRKTMLLATDQQQSVLNTLDGNEPRSTAYTPYGHRSPENGLLSLIGFNGEPPDALTGHYHLGNGYRQFNPVLMRFNSPDSWSPFGEGGLNAYAYCGGDPRNRTDPTGHILGIGTALAKKGLGWKTMRPKTSPTSKKVVMGHISPGKNGPIGSHQIKGSGTDINAFTPKEIEYQTAAFQKFEQTKKWNELVPPKQLTRPDGSQAIIPTRTKEIVPSNIRHSNLYEDFLNNSLGSANTAPVGELINNLEWLSQAPGPSRLVKKLEYTQHKIRQNIDRQLS